jgi:dTDP-4-dehydrorhamnose reductase
MPTKRKILITGSSGMLGIDLCKELRHSYDVIGADIVGSRKLGVGSWEFKKADITNKKNIEAIVKKIRPYIVIHAAAMTDVDGCELDPKRAYKINSIGAKNVALACKAADATLIYISTDFVFDGKKKKPYKETDKTHPLSIYADSKLKGEEEVKNILKKYYILRTSWLYGKNGKNFVDTIVSKAKNEKVLKVVNDQVGSPTYTIDLAKAICALLDKVFVQRTAYSVQRKNTKYDVRSTMYGIFHISNSGRVSWYDYAKEILKLAGSKTKVVPISSQKLARPAKRPAMSVLDNSKFIKFTDYRMRKWREALKEYV